MNHCMIDIETCGSRFDAPVLSIGAVKFDPDTGNTGETFYRAIRPDSAFQHGTPGGDTFKWWMDQADEARKAAVGGTDDLQIALGALTSFYREWSNVKVWGNGPSFDMTILEYAFAQIGRPHPWKFWNVLDCRTVAALAGKRPPAIGSKGVYHNALHDALHQAEWVGAMWQGLRNKPAVQHQDSDILI